MWEDERLIKRQSTLVESPRLFANRWMKKEGTS